MIEYRNETYTTMEIIGILKLRIKQYENLAKESPQPEIGSKIDELILLVILFQSN